MRRRSIRDSAGEIPFPACGVAGGMVEEINTLAGFVAKYGIGRSKNGFDRGGCNGTSVVGAADAAIAAKGKKSVNLLLIKGIFSILSILLPIFIMVFLKVSNIPINGI